MTSQAQEIMGALPKKDWPERQRAIGELIACPEHDFIGELEKGMRNHEDADARNAAMEVYKALGIRGFASLSTLLQDSDHEVRLFAVNVLCNIADPGAFPLLAAAIQDSDVNVRVAAAEALGRIRDVRAVPVLGKAVHDEPWVAMAAVNALGEIGGTDALRVLRSCLEIESCRELAISALGNAGNLDSIEHLAACFDYDGLSELALQATVRIAERHKARPQPEYFMHYIPKLLKMVKSADPETKKAAIRAICWSRNISAQQCLIDAVKDEELQECAVEGIIQLGKRIVAGVIDEIRKSSGPHRRALVRALDMMDEQPALLRFAGDADPVVRRQVAHSLGEVRIPRAVQVLRSMMNDPDEEVRIAARKSLGNVGEAC
ncbi:MAG TPA: HEAT repeat domain-containing protein [Thermodesulfovibrionales bacterium]|nr:HEAT repeat domain-containing protein [Thermodesulfovibrionales bacterium]